VVKKSKSEEVWRRLLDIVGPKRTHNCQPELRASFSVGCSMKITYLGGFANRERQPPSINEAACTELEAALGKDSAPC
jgi:hypothetical protein